MLDPTQQSEPVTPDPNQSDLQAQQVVQYLAYHNTLIIGFYENESDAVDALNGYQMSNTVDINDVAQVISVNIPLQ